MGALWHNRDFRRLWAAQTVSQFGTEITDLALPLLAILVLHASTFEVAALAVVDWLPFFLFSLPAGVWIDRLPRRPILIAADVGRALALGSIPLAYLFDVLTLGQLYLVGLVAGTFTVFFDLSYQSYLPSVVERDELGEGNAKLEVSRSSAQVAGPGIAGVLVSTVTAPYAILVDAISFSLRRSFSHGSGGGSGSPREAASSDPDSGRRSARGFASCGGTRSSGRSCSSLPSATSA